MSHYPKGLCLEALLVYLVTKWYSCSKPVYFPNLRAHSPHLHPDIKYSLFPSALAITTSTM